MPNYNFISATQNRIAMRILMIAPQPFFEPRGTPISIYDRLMALSTLGHQIDLVTYHIGQDKEFPGVVIFRSLHLPFIRRIKIGPSFSKVFLDIFLFLKAFSLLVKNQYDVIHSHEEASYFSVILGKLFKTQHIYDMHSRLPWQLRNSKYANWKPVVWLFDWLEKKTLLSCDAIIAIGNDLEEYVKQTNPSVPNIRIENLPLYVNFGVDSTEDIKELRQKLNLDGKIAVVYTGTFEPYQGLDLLLESASHAAKLNANVIYILVGGTEAQVNVYTNKVRNLGLEKHFIFIGTVSPVEAIKYLEIADVLVSPRLGGMSIPLKIYTYLFSGKPILATNIPAHQMVGEARIHLVEPTSAELSDGLMDIINQRDKFISNQENTKRKEELRAIKTTYLTKVEEIYRKLQNKPARLESPVSN